MEKNKIIYSNLMTNGFFDAACYLKKCEMKDGNLIGIYAPAYTANLALTCELYFKQLLYIRGIAVTEKGKKIHGLKALFAKIPTEIQDEIKEKYRNAILSRTNVNKSIQIMSVEKCLETYDTAFEDWRYTYEGNKVCNTVAEKDFFDFVGAVKVVADEKTK